MQVHTSKIRLSAALLALALGAAACGGGEDEGTPSTDAAPTGGSFSIPTNDPERPLLPADTNESEGSQIVSALFTGLVEYDAETSEATMDGVAESITSDDSTTWTIKLKPWTFHDGTPVTSDSFIKAWNYGANSANAQGGSYFFANIEGYKDLQGKDAAAPAKTEMSGLKKVSDTEFTVTLSAPFRQYPITVGYNSFFPLPESFFADKAAQTAYGKKPVGNGPFKADTEYVPGKGMTLSKYADFPGEKAKADTVEIKTYTDTAVSYTDLQGGNLDIQDVVPPDAIATFKEEFGDRALERESSQFDYVGFPTFDPRYKDKRVRQAFSMAIDRKAISEAIFNDTRAPASSLVSPVVDGSRPDACKYCEYKPDEAKKLLAETGFDTSKPVDLWFNAGAGGDDYFQAIGNNLRDNLGITYKLQGGLQFAEYLPKIDAKGITGPYRLGWSMDYPSPQNYLEPLYSTAALPPNGSNGSFYSNKAFDEKVAEGNAADTNEGAITAYQAAEDLVLEDMPVMPMFFRKIQSAHSEKVSNVVVDAFGRIRLEDVTVKQ